MMNPRSLHDNPFTHFAFLQLVKFWAIKQHIPRNTAFVHLLDNKLGVFEITLEDDTLVFIDHATASSAMFSRRQGEWVKIPLE